MSCIICVVAYITYAKFVQNIYSKLHMCIVINNIVELCGILYLINEHQFSYLSSFGSSGNVKNGPTATYATS